MSTLILLQSTYSVSQPFPQVGSILDARHALMSSHKVLAEPVHCELLWQTISLCLEARESVSYNRNM